jgi:hypothetical protein
MTPVIQQRVRFRTSPQALFDLYRDSRRHLFPVAHPLPSAARSAENSRHLRASSKARTC